MLSVNPHLAAHILQQLKNTKALVPTQAWLATFVSAQRAGLPINALASTASFRLLAADIKTCLDASASQTLPADVTNEALEERRLEGPIVVQVLDIEDVSRSRWSQIEEMEADERGERTKGREIIRVVPPEDGRENPDDAAGASNSAGPHKLLLEDIRGSKVYGVELARVEGIGLAMNIGSKLVLRDVLVARGVLLLEPSPKTTLLGGKIEHLHAHWRANRKAQLTAAVKPQTEPAGTSRS